MGFKSAITGKTGLALALTLSPVIVLDGIASARGDSYAFVKAELLGLWNRTFPSHKAKGETMTCDYNRTRVHAGYVFDCQIYNLKSAEIGHMRLVTQTHQAGYTWGYSVHSWPY